MYIKNVLKIGRAVSEEFEFCTLPLLSSLGRLSTATVSHVSGSKIISEPPAI